MKEKCSGLMCAGCTSYGVCDCEIIDPIGVLAEAHKMLQDAGLESPEVSVDSFNEKDGA